MAPAQREGDAISFGRSGFALEPSAAYEVRTAPGGMGCEDPRVTFGPVPARYGMAYTALGPAGPRIAPALSRPLPAPASRVAGAEHS